MRFRWQVTGGEIGWEPQNNRILGLPYSSRVVRNPRLFKPCNARPGGVHRTATDDIGIEAIRRTQAKRRQ
jgi:hypothetical protein